MARTATTGLVLHPARLAHALGLEACEGVCLLQRRAREALQRLCPHRADHGVPRSAWDLAAQTAARAARRALGHFAVALRDAARTLIAVVALADAYDAVLAAARLARLATQGAKLFRGLRLSANVLVIGGEALLARYGRVAGESLHRQRARYARLASAQVQSAGIAVPRPELWPDCVTESVCEPPLLPSLHTAHTIVLCAAVLALHVSGRHLRVELSDGA